VVWKEGNMGFDGGKCFIKGVLSVDSGIRGVEETLKHIENRIQ